MNAICVFLLVYLTVTVESWCPKQDTLINTEVRECKISCENDGDCSATNKECLCDGECGMTCFNPRAECPEPERIPHGSYKTSTLSMQGKAIYTCYQGYVLIGKNKRICRADKKWHGALPACKKGCLDPPQVGNAYPNIAKHTFEMDEEVTYLCRTGYYIEDRSIARRTCQSDGTWTVATFHCNLQICGEIYPISNGEITINKDKNYFGSTATLQCNPGYDSFPSGANRRCFAGSVENSRFGKWTGSFPSCNIKSCPSPKDPANGEVVERAWVVLEFGNKISYKCDVGYKIEGESIRQCDHLGTWGIMPTCAVDPDCDFNDHSSPSCGYTNNANEWDRYGITENSGFPGYVSRARYKGSKLISPEIAADWSSHQFICLKFDYYLHPVSSLAIESTRNFDGFSISWNTNKNEVSHTWLDAILNIETTTSIKYQFDAKNPTVYLDNVQVQKEKCVEHCRSIPCENEGSCVNRIHTYTCFCTIYFKGPTCNTAITCRNPPFKPNQNVVGKKTSWRVGETVEIECNEGYAFEASNPQTIFTCAHDEGWLGTITTCHDIKCSNPRNSISNGKRTYRSWWSIVWFPTPGSTARYECDDNYKLDDGLKEIQKIKTIICRSNSWFRRSWWSPDPSKIRCVDIECASPVLHSHQTLDSHVGKWKVNSEATYRCDPGYEFSSGGETRFIRCRSNEAWTSADDDDKCIKTITCKNPRFKSNQQAIGEKRSWRVDETVEVKCNFGYAFKASNPKTTLTCRNDERWFGTITTCYDIKCMDPASIITNGKRTDKSWYQFPFPRDTVGYECDDNYKMYRLKGIQKGRTITCIGSSWFSRSRWNPDPIEIQCVDIECASPVLRSHQTLDSHVGKWKVNSEAIYRCEPGYEFSSGGERRFIRCKNNEAWTSSDYDDECIKSITCKNPPFKSNQQAVGEKRSWRVDETVEVKCNNGYAFKASNPKTTLTCRNDERWFGTITTCYAVDENTTTPHIVYSSTSKTTTAQPKEVIITQQPPQSNSTTPKTKPGCQPPNLPEHSYIINDTASYSIRQRFHLKCKENYEMVAIKNFIKCKSDQTWTKTNAKCKAADENTTTPHIVYSSTSKTTTAQPKELIITQQTPQSSNTTTETKLGCQPPNLPEHSYIINDTASYSITQRFHLKCKENYELVAIKNFIKCKSDQTWTKTNAKCKDGRNLHCNAPLLSQRALMTHDPKNYTVGTKIHLSCIEDKILVGCFETVCKPNQQWSDCEYSCKTSICLLDKYLMPVELYVEGFHAKALYEEKFANGREVTLSCNGKMVPIQDNQETYTTPTSTCKLGGRWSPHIEDFHCVVACYSPLEPTNGHWIQEPKRNIFKALEKISFKCDDGYTYGQNVHYVECKDNGRWRVLENACKKNFCTLNPDVFGDGIRVNNHTNDQLETVRFHISDSIVLSCPDGEKPYENDKKYIDPTLTCQRNRLWSKDPKLFKCKNVCSNPPDVESIDWQNLREWYGIGETVWYRCKSGFLHTGTSAEVHCDKDGQWSDLSNLCVKTDYPVQNIDLVFLLDGSGSVGVENFKIIKLWVKNITEHFDMKRSTKIGVVQYSHLYKDRPLHKQPQIKTEIVLGQITNISEFKSAVDGITLFGSKTYTAHAINKTVYDFESSIRFDDNSTKKVLLLLTDGKSTDNEYLLSTAEYVRSVGIKTYAVGVGKNYVRKELQIIANGQIGNDDRVFHATSFEDLESLIEDITVHVTGTIGQSSDCTVLTSSLNDGVKVVGQSVDDDDKILISLHSSINFYCSETKQPFLQQQQYINPITTCQNDRTWSIDPTDFVCKSICASPSSMENGDWNDQHMREFYEVDEILWFTCDEEYTHTGSDSKSTCLSSGEWSVSSCRAIKK